MRKQIAIVMLTYNREDKLKRAIDSVMRQTFHDYVLIVVNDASTDSTKDFLRKKFKEVENKMIIIDRQTNSNKRIGYLKNIALATLDQIMQYKYVCFLDDDNYYEPHYLTELHREIERTKADMVYCDSRGWKETSDGPYGLGVQRSQDFDSALLKQGNFIDLGEVIVKRSVLRAVNGFSDFVGCGDDWDCWLKIAGKGYKITHYPYALTNYLWHPNQTTNDTGHQEIINTIKRRIQEGYYGKDYN